MILSRSRLARLLALVLGGPEPHRGRAVACATLAAMSTDSRPAAAELRQASPMPLKPSLEGIEEKWSRRWEEAGVVQV
jgi:hypothetical protein